MASNLPTTQKAQDIRGLLERSRKQIAMALPKHLTADRLLRVAMTSIQKTPKLLDCTPQSLLACVMTCAQLGLEPDQFLGQAYLVPFKDTSKGVTICTLIPGYRGYIALARRSGELQTVSAQVVYSNDDFKLQYGVADTLEHTPPLDGSDRGKPIGAYCVFKYKDGGYSFDFMSVADIEKIRSRSKAAGNGPWVTDWDEMAKKTVIKRHSKLAPLSVEFQRAVALEDRAMSGESQADLLGMDDPDTIDAEPSESRPDLSAQVAEFDKATEGKPLMGAYITVAVKHFKKPADEIKAEAMKDLPGFMGAYEKWAKAQEQKEALKSKASEKVEEMAPAECPNAPGTTYKKSHCDKCPSRKGCPAWPA